MHSSPGRKLGGGLRTCLPGTSPSPAWHLFSAGSSGDRVGWYVNAVSTCLHLSTESECIQSHFTGFSNFDGNNVADVPILLDGEESSGFCIELNY